MKDIVIVGHGGFAKEVALLIDDINRERKTWNILGYISDNTGNTGSPHGKYMVFNSDSWLEDLDREMHVSIGIGNPNVINKVRSRLSRNDNLIFPNIIHPRATIDRDRVMFGEGNIVCAGTIFTTDIVVGSFNIFNLSCTIGHDVVIGDCNVFNPTTNISGGVRISNEVLIGTGSQILQYLSICNESVIGAGAVVAKDIDEPGIYVGIPARKLNK